MRTLTKFLLPLSPRPATLVAAGISAEFATNGVMLCLRPPAELAQRIAVPSGDKPDQLHVTLIYLGKLGDIPQAELDKLTRQMPFIAANMPQIGLSFNRIGRLGDNNATVLMGDNGSLKRWRELLSTYLRDYVTWVDTYAFLPHMTLGYWMTDAEAPEIGPYNEAVSWVSDSIYLKIGPNESRYPVDNTSNSVEGPLYFEGEEELEPQVSASASLTTTVRIR